LFTIYRGKIIGRKQEIEELDNLYKSDRAEFVAIYGRRRVGKTFLVKELFQDKMSFYHSGLSPYDKERKITMRDQLEAFYASLMNFGMEENRCPKTWMEAFRMLGSLLDQLDDGTRQVIFIDELPWMDTARSKFLPALENFWNTWGAWRDRVMLIVCGSATSWMLDNLINRKGGLYDRLTWQIKLSPFTLGECKAFFDSRQIIMSPYDLIECYMVLGGIPYYMNYFQRGKSLAQNIDLLFFNRNAKLSSEFHRLFGSLFGNPENYMEVVRLLAKRYSGYTREEIVTQLKITSGGTLSKMLEALTASDFITTYCPFGQPQKTVCYKLTDSFCQFYLHFIDGQKMTDEAFWLHHQNMPPINSWRGLAFEQICFLHANSIKKALGIEGVASTQSAWIVRGDNDKKGAQIDMLIIRDDRIVNLCEMKFLSKEYEPNVEDEMVYRNRIATLQEKLSFKQTVHLTLVTTVGLKHNAHSGVFQKIVTLPALFH
jgi:AAA+ ATPase superfamily predicted ATPase